MKSFRRSAVLSSILAAFVFASTHAQQAPPSDSLVLSAKQWSNDVWFAARSGDEEAL